MKKLLFLALVLPFIAVSCTKKGAEDISGSDDPSTPSGKQTRLSAGWYESGAFESYVAMYAKNMQSAGDDEGLMNLPNEDYMNSEIPTAIHIVDEYTLEWACAYFSTSNPKTDYYATKTYGSVKYFFYYAYADSYYEYKVTNNVIYVKNEDEDKWVELGKYSNNIITSDWYNGKTEYRKIKYNGDYEW